MTSTPAIPPPFSITVDRHDAAHVVHAVGELDLSTREQLQAVLDDLPRPPLMVVLDLAGLSFVDSTGLKTILDEHRRAREDGYEFVVAGANDAVRDVFRVTALDLTLPLAPDVASVLED